jgi:hypothetical protein
MFSHLSPIFFGLEMLAITSSVLLWLAIAVSWLLKKSYLAEDHLTFKKSLAG